MASANPRPMLTSLNEHLVCTLCNGYLIDATSIVECLHSFCRSCIVRYLQASSFCPTCEVQLHKGSPLRSLKPDKSLQDIVYKLVPNLFQNEMLRRKTYYDAHPEYVLCTTPEQRGEGVERFYSTDDKFSLALEYVSESDAARGLASPPPSSGSKDPVLKHYLRCPTLFTIRLLKKFIRNKLDLPPEVTVDIFQRRESLCDDYTLLDIAYIYPWKKSAPMSFYYRVTDPAAAPPVNDVEREMPSLRPVALTPATPVAVTSTPRVVRPSRRSVSTEQTPSAKVAATPPALPATEPAERRQPPLPSLVIKGSPVSSSASGSPVTYTVTVKTPSTPQPSNPVLQTPSRPKTPKMNGTPVPPPAAPKTTGMPTTPKPTVLPTPPKAAVLPTPTKAAVLPTPLKSAVLPTPPKSAVLPTPPKSTVLPTPPKSTVLPTPTKSAVLPTPSKSPMLPTPPKSAVLPIIASKVVGSTPLPTPTNKTVPMTTYVTKLKTLAPKSLKSRPKSNSPALAASPVITPAAASSPTSTPSSREATTPTPVSSASATTDPALNPLLATASPASNSTPTTPSSPATPRPPTQKPKQKLIPIVPKPVAGFVASWKPQPNVKVPVKIAPKSTSESSSSEPTSPSTALSNAVSLLQSNGITVSTSPSPNTTSTAPKTPRPADVPKKATPARAIPAPVLTAPASPSPATASSTSASSTAPAVVPLSGQTATSRSDEDTAKVETAQAILQLSMGFKRSLSPPDPVLSRRISAIVAEINAVKSESSPRSTPSPPAKREAVSPLPEKKVDTEDSEVKRRKTESTPKTINTESSTQVPTKADNLSLSATDSPKTVSQLSTTSKPSLSTATPAPSSLPKSPPPKPIQPTPSTLPKSPSRKPTPTPASKQPPSPSSTSASSSVTISTYSASSSSLPSSALAASTSSTRRPNGVSASQVPSAAAAPKLPSQESTTASSPLSSPQGSQSSKRPTPPPQPQQQQQQPSQPSQPSLKRPAASALVDTKTAPAPPKQQRIKEVDKIALVIKQKRLQEQPSQKSPLPFFLDGMSNQASPAKSRKPVPDLLPRLSDKACAGAPLDLSATSSPRAPDHGGSWSPPQSLAQVLARRQHQVNGTASAARPSSLSSSSPSPPADTPVGPGSASNAAFLDSLAQHSLLLQQLHMQNLLREGLSPLTLPHTDIWEFFGRHQAAAAAAATAAAAVGKRSK